MLRPTIPRAIHDPHLSPDSTSQRLDLVPRHCVRQMSCQSELVWAPSCFSLFSSWSLPAPTSIVLSFFSCLKTVASWRMSQLLQHYQCWSVCTLGAKSAAQTSGEKASHSHEKRTQLRTLQRTILQHFGAFTNDVPAIMDYSQTHVMKLKTLPQGPASRTTSALEGSLCALFFVVFLLCLKTKAP